MTDDLDVVNAMDKIRHQLDQVVLNSRSLFPGRPHLAMAAVYATMLERTLIMKQALTAIKSDGLEDIENMVSKNLNQPIRFKRKYPEANFTSIQSLYNVWGKKEVKAFIEEFPEIVDLLIDVHGNIRLFFKDEMLTLRIFENFPGNETSLKIEVYPSEVEHTADNELRLFKEFWWNEASYTYKWGSKLHIELAKPKVKNDQKP